MNVSSGAPATSVTCRSCLHFVNDPRALERSFVGIAALSSAFGSTRGRAGICLKESTFRDPGPACPVFEARIREVKS